MSTALRHDRSRRLNRELVTTYVIVAVLMAYFALRHFYPTLFAFFVSFNKYDLLTGAFSFVGIDNYLDTFTDQRSLRSIANTSIYVVGNVVGDTLLGLFFALLLDRMGRGSVVLRTIYFMPVVVSVVALAQLWIWIYHRDLGLLNWALSLVGIGKVGWLVDTRYALSSIIIMNVWREMGFALVIFMAGLKTIPEHFYDAARVDGASAWQVARRVTIPLLTPITLLVVVVNTIGAFKVFTQVFVMGQQGGTYFGGPMNSTLTIVLKIYETSFTDFRIGAGQSLAFVLTAIVVVITTLQRKAFKRFDYDY